MNRRIRYVNVVLKLALVLAAGFSTALAASLADVTVPDEAKVAGKNLVLNGLGLRTATFLKVKVYVIGLYLVTESSDANAIIASAGPKRIELHFLHDVSADELRDGWSEGFEANYDDVDSIKSEIEKFNASMRDVKSGDMIALDFTADSLDVTINGNKIDAISGSDFQAAALSIWLGRKPPNDDLKKGILGAHGRAPA
jgi:hypothetical protein